MNRLRMPMLLVVAATATLSIAPPAHAAGDEGVPSRVVLLSDHSTPVKTWQPLPVRVRLEAEDGTPLAGRYMRIWDDSYVRWRCCGPPPWRTTDANGELSAVLNLDGNSRNPVRVAVYWHGDAVYRKAIVEWYQPMVGYDTALTVSHAAHRTSGLTLPVTLTVRRTDPLTTNACIDDTVVPVTLAGPETRTVTAVTDGCSATVEIPLDVTPGAYTLTASTGHDGWLRTDEPSSYSALVTVAWQHTFTDAEGRGTVFVNMATKQYRVVLSDGRDSGVVYAGDGLTKTGVTGTVSVWRIDLSHAEGGDSATGSFYSTGNFAAYGVLDGVPWDLGR